MISSKAVYVPNSPPLGKLPIFSPRAHSLGVPPGTSLIPQGSTKNTNKNKQKRKGRENNLMLKPWTTLDALFYSLGDVYQMPSMASRCKMSFRTPVDFYNAPGHLGMWPETLGCQQRKRKQVASYDIRSWAMEWKVVQKACVLSEFFLHVRIKTIGIIKSPDSQL